MRALGFSRASIRTASVVESAFLAIVGGALGCLGAGFREIWGHGA